MKTIFIVWVNVLATTSLLGQQALFENESTTRAVVIGISDYEDERIPDLQFADRDAEAFAEWLRSAAGGSVPEQNILLHTNDAATNMEIWMSIDWLVKNSRAGDRAFIYFSGHGDVENVTMFNKGFLLAYDSPAVVYGAGAFPVDQLQDVIATLSNNGVNVIVISDACRAGKLTDKDISGSQLTSQRLQEKFANEIKILSCQPDEISLEGVQWGGGRGCFSYHLENALYGFADLNKDQQVSLLELRRYLEDKVSREAAPESQIPMVEGPTKEPIAIVDPELLARRRKSQEHSEPEYLAIQNRTLEKMVFERADTNIYQEYEAFLAALDSNFLMEPKGRSANDYFDKLMGYPELTRLHGTITRKFTVALMNEAQEVVNRLLRTDPQVVDDVFPGRVRYEHIPTYLQRAADILGEDHYIYPYIKAKQLFFESKTFNHEKHPDLSADSLFALVNEKLDQALSYHPEAAYILLEKGVFYYWTQIQFDSAQVYFQKALEISPNWVLALYYYGRNRINFDNDYAGAISYMEKAIAYDSTFLPAYERLGFFSWYLNREDVSFLEEYIRKMKAMEAEAPEHIPFVYFRYMGMALSYLNRLDEAMYYLEKYGNMIAYEDPMYFRNLWIVYGKQGNFFEEARMADQYLELRPNDHNKRLCLSLGRLKFEKALPCLVEEHETHRSEESMWGCQLYVMYLNAHQFEESRRIGKEHQKTLSSPGAIETISPIRRSLRLLYYGGLDSARNVILPFLEVLEQAGDGLIDSMPARSYLPYCYGLLIYGSLMKGNLEEAESWYARLVEKDLLQQDENNLFVFYIPINSWLAFAQGDLDKADSIFSKSLSQKGLDEFIQNQILSLVSASGDADYPIFLLEKLKKGHPDRIDLNYHLGRLYVEQKNDPEKGIPLLKKAVELEPRFPYSLYHLGAAYASINETAEAMLYLEKAFVAGFEDFKEFAKDIRWDSMRSSQPFQQLVERYVKE